MSNPFEVIILVWHMNLHSRFVRISNLRSLAAPYLVSFVIETTIKIIKNIVCVIVRYISNSRVKENKVEQRHATHVISNYYLYGAPLLNYSSFNEFN